MMLRTHPAAPSKAILRVPVENIDPNPYQPRKIFDRQTLAELSDSILTFGLLQPISVRRTDDGRYVLISGERRWRATRLAGLSHIDAVIQNVKESDAALLALIENMQRENLHFLEEAEGYAALLRDHRITQEELAQKLSKNQSTIANKLRLLRLSPAVRAQAFENDLTERHTRALLRLPDEASQINMIELIKRFGWNVRKTEEAIELTLKRLAEERQARVRSQNTKVRIRDPRLFINSMQVVVQQMKEAGFNPLWEQARSDAEIVVKIVIPLAGK